MTSIVTAIPSGSKGGSGAKVRLLSLDSIDGRTRAAQSLQASIEAIESDLGGGDHLAAGVRKIVRRAALAGVMSEDLGARWLLGEPVDPALYAALVNAECNLLETAGLNRPQQRIRKNRPRAGGGVNLIRARVRS